MEIKVRLRGDIRYWDNIPVSMRTRPLENDERFELIGQLTEFCQTEFVVGIRWNIEGDLNGNYIVNRNYYAKKEGDFFRWIDEGMLESKQGINVEST